MHRGGLLYFPVGLNPEPDRVIVYFVLVMIIMDMGLSLVMVCTKLHIFPCAEKTVYRVHSKAHGMRVISQANTRTAWLLSRVHTWAHVHPANGSSSRPHPLSGLSNSMVLVSAALSHSSGCLSRRKKHAQRIFARTHNHTRPSYHNPPSFYVM